MLEAKRMQRTIRTCLTLALGAALTAAAAHAADDEPDRPSPATLASLARKTAPSLVVVEITPQTDKGETPSSRFTRESLLSNSTLDWGGLIREERPAEVAGYLLTGQRVATSDPKLHPRFIRRIAVRQGERVVDASIAGYGRDRDVLILKLASPLPEAQPLEFDSSRPGPYRQVRFTQEDGRWGISASPLGEDATSVRVTANPADAVQVRSKGLYVDSAGTPVALVGTAQRPLATDWRETPDDWPLISADEMRAALEEIEKLAAAALLRVNLRFRSPRNPSESSPYTRFSFNEDDNQELTEWNGVGVLVDETTLLVLAKLKPKVTGRLEAISVFTADDRRVEATFAGTLEDYGAFLAMLSEPLPGAVHVVREPIQDYEEKLLLKAQLRILGESRIAYFWRDRVTSFSLGWRRQVYPNVTATSDGGRAPWDDDKTTGLNFLFTLDGRLLAAPLARRERVAAGKDWRSWNPFSTGGQVLAAAYLEPILAARAENIDPENRPLSEEEENRLAWLGVELQALNPELARMNNVGEETANGSSGAVVMFIYPDSPALAAGLKLGDILLRIHIEGYPQPMKVSLSGSSPFSGMMGRFPAEFYDENMPKPWGAVENALTRALTDVGFGKRFKIEVFRKGEIFTKDLVVTEGPPHYESAPRVKSEAGGFTARDVTYEVRRYFQMSTDDPGVIVSKIERGGPAAIAGLRPLELIVSIDDTPVKTVADLKQRLAPGGEFRLNVKRLTTSRVLTLKIKPESESK